MMQIDISRLYETETCMQKKHSFSAASLHCLWKTDSFDQLGCVPFRI